MRCDNGDGFTYYKYNDPLIGKKIEFRDDSNVKWVGLKKLFERAFKGEALTNYSVTLEEGIALIKF